MHILGQMWCGKEGGRAVAPQFSDTADGPSLAHPLASSICLGLSESEQNPIFSPVVRRSDSRIEQWSEILPDSERKGGKARSPLGVGTVKREH